MATSKTKYEVLNGLNYPPKQRAEIGEIRDDIPGDSISWLLEAGHIRVADPSAKVTPPKAATPVPTLESSSTDEAASTSPVEEEEGEV